MSQNLIATLRNIVLSGSVTLPKGETLEDILQHLNSFDSESDDQEKDEGDKEDEDE